MQLPSLRERKEDIPLLVQHFLEQVRGREPEAGAHALTPEAMDRLASYNWPGNVRELENVIERAVVLSGDREIGPDLLPDQVSPASAAAELVIPPEGIAFREVIIGHERRYIEAALDAAGGVQKKAAELLHIKPTTLNEMIKRYDIRPRRRKGFGDTRDDVEPGQTAGRGRSSDRLPSRTLAAAAAIVRAIAWSMPIASVRPARSRPLSRRGSIAPASRGRSRSGARSGSRAGCVRNRAINRSYFVRIALHR